MSLKGKRIIITGASRGVGRAISLACAKEGAAVILLARRKDALSETVENIKQKGGQAFFYAVDLTDEFQVRDCISLMAKRFDSFDALINNAGMGHWSSVVDMSVSTWDEVMSLNVRSVFLMCKYVLPHMYAKKQGHVINISSVQAFRGVPNLAAYCTSKSALEGFTKCLYEESKPRGVKVTIILPSQVNTGFRDNMKGRKPHSEKEKANMLTPEDVASSVLWTLNTSFTSLPVSLVLEMRGEQ